MKETQIQISRRKLQLLYVKKKMSTHKISRLYNCNAETIRRRLFEQGIKRRYREIKIKIPSKELIKSYNKERKSTLELAKKYGCSQWTIRSNLIKNKVSLRTSSDFLKWKSPANQIRPNLKNSLTLSYVLGVLLGDGWVYNHKNNYFIGLDSIDYAFCKSFSDSLKSLKLNPNLFPRRDQWRVVASSKIFHNWFKHIKFWQIKKIALSYPFSFLKGFYESEGCLARNYNRKINKIYYLIIIINTRKDLIKLSEYLLKKVGFNPKVNFRKTPLHKKDIWVLNLNKQEEVKKFIRETNPVIKNRHKI